MVATLQNLNNKGLIDDDIKNLFMCMCVCLGALDLRNGATHEYEICTAYWCGDTLKSEVLF